jgi:hypothetical protein
MQYYVADNNFASLCAKLATSNFWASNGLNVPLSNLSKFILQIAWNDHHLDFKTTPLKKKVLVYHLSSLQKCDSVTTKIRDKTLHVQINMILHPEPQYFNVSCSRNTLVTFYEVHNLFSGMSIYIMPKAYS